MTGLESAFPDIYLKSGKTIKRLGGKEYFYIHTKAQHHYEFKLPPGFQVTLPQNLARALGYLNYQDHVSALYDISAPNAVQLQKDHCAEKR